MTPKEFLEGALVFARIGITTEEASSGIKKVSSTLHKIMVEEINELAKSRGINFEEAEKIYISRLDTLSGKNGRFAQKLEMARIRRMIT